MFLSSGTIQLIFIILGKILADTACALFVLYLDLALSDMYNDIVHKLVNTKI